MSLPVSLAPRATEQLAALADYASQFPANGRLNLLAAAADKVRLLEAQPEMYPVSSQKPPLRRCVVTKTISLYYRLTPTHCEVVGFIDSRSDPATLGLPPA